MLPCVFIAVGDGLMLLTCTKCNLKRPESIELRRCRAMTGGELHLGFPSTNLCSCQSLQASLLTEHKKLRQHCRSGIQAISYVNA